jgi:hypothetical protein
MGIEFFLYAVKYGQKVFQRQIGGLTVVRAVASAMQTVEIASQCTLPEEIAEIMRNCIHTPFGRVKVERNPFLEGKP